MKYPLFPLSAHILPEGRMSLRIFEPRYVRMVKEACGSSSGFVICMLNAKGNKDTNQHIHQIGTYCEVIDFELMDDGLLGIQVEGKYCVAISAVETESDGLRIGSCEAVAQWQCDFDTQSISPMDERLKEVFERFNDIGGQYQQLKFNDPIWVINRWLELLPVDAEQKQFFLKQQDASSIVNYLTELIE